MKEESEKSVSKRRLNVAKLVEFECNPEEKAFIDAYMLNGYNKRRAALEVRPDLKLTGADAWANDVWNREPVRLYLKEKQAMLRQEANVSQYQVLKELLSYAYSDITTYIGLGPDELRELPPDVRRCIDSVDTTTKTYLNADKKLVKEVSVKIKLVNKLRAIDMISKHINFYEADNRSRSGTIDLTNATNDQLNAVLDLIKQQQQNKAIE